MKGRVGTHTLPVISASQSVGRGENLHLPPCLALGGAASPDLEGMDSRRDCGKISGLVRMRKVVSLSLVSVSPESRARLLCVEAGGYPGPPDLEAVPPVAPNSE